MDNIWILEYFDAYEACSAIKVYKYEQTARSILSDFVKNKHIWKKQDTDNDSLKDETVIEHWENRKDQIGIRLHRCLIII